MLLLVIFFSEAIKLLSYWCDVGQTERTWCELLWQYDSIELDVLLQTAVDWLFMDRYSHCWCYRRDCQVECYWQERLLVLHVKYCLEFVSHSDLLQRDLAEYLLVTTSDMWKLNQVSLLLQDFLIDDYGLMQFNKIINFLQVFLTSYSDVKLSFLRCEALHARMTFRLSCLWRMLI